MRTGFVTHHDCSRHDTGWGHAEHQGRLPAVARAVYRDMLTLHDALVEVEGRPATEEDLLLAHDADHLARVRGAVAAAEEAGQPVPFEKGTMVSGATWDALTAAAGCAITAVDLVLDGGARNAFCSVRPPGSGAGRGSAGNHAIVNHAAVAALHLRERRGAERVLVMEWGERFGRGTDEILAGSGSDYLSFHSAADGNAGSGPTSVPLPVGAGGDALADALRRHGAEAARGADFIVLSFGLDVLESDPEGTLAVQPGELHAVTRALVEIAEGCCGGRLVSILEGGYDPPATGRAVVQHLRAMAGLAP